MITIRPKHGNHSMAIQMALAFFAKDEVIFLVNHFTGFQVHGEASESLVKVGAFGDVLDLSRGRYEFRVHIWKHSEFAEQVNIIKQ